MWDEIRRIQDGWFGPWCIGGDFNAILHSQERSTRVCPSDAMVEFQDFVNYSALMDLPLGGGGRLYFGPGVEMNRYVQGWTAILCWQIGRSFFRT